jgi:hypothetical protein
MRYMSATVPNHILDEDVHDPSHWDEAYQAERMISPKTVGTSDNDQTPSVSSFHQHEFLIWDIRYIRYIIVMSDRKMNHLRVGIADILSYLW